MPQYDYRCLTCERRFEVQHAISEGATLFCPDCGGFCDKVLDKAPALLTAVAERQGHETRHECGAACVLHLPESEWAFMPSVSAG